MDSLELIEYQTTTLRGTIARSVQPHLAKADLIPPTWKNNLRWQVGHLVTVPHLLTYGLLGEPLPIPAEYRGWFGARTSPADWKGARIPEMDVLVDELTASIPRIFREIKPRADKQFSEPFTSGAGVTMRSPRETLTFSFAHDGIHLGMILALGRALKN